ncbi:glycine betaine ABC transporter substrate-binding protein [Lacticaseibacillus zhaodongensis]|uniref:glycine betaine ABC transporter substrate-binding protein n=1 Tax=Lacticaseibacillus zhaodongensis TaxID=2668065 RepID=UPI001E6560CF|nr:glycine betaine ABC transporter substrate-binding protein [Lacticaseibacillus zhaodongensis]
MHKVTKLKLLLSGLALLLVVPLAACSAKAAAYDSSKPLGPQVNYTITGIDAGAGEMETTQKALKQYHLEDHKWQLQTSSTAAMTTQLGKDIKNKQPIVITGWQPHWMFTKYKLKFLKDPKNVYGSSENIHTIVRKGLKKDKPSAYTVLDRFYWTPAQMSAVMIKVNAGMAPRKAAREWLKAHPEQLAKWTKGVKHVHGDKIKMTYVSWDSEIASSFVAAEALRTVGYKPTLQAMEMQPLWASIATNAADAMTCAWLPNTSGRFYHQYRSEITDLGVNLRGAKVGLAVPTYMTNVNSIEDLKK